MLDGGGQQDEALLGGGGGHPVAVGAEPALVPALAGAGAGDGEQVVLAAVEGLPALGGSGPALEVLERGPAPSRIAVSNSQTGVPSSVTSPPDCSSVVKWTMGRASGPSAVLGQAYIVIIC